MIKEAWSVSDLWSSGKEAVKAGADLGMQLYNHLDKLAWLLVPGVGVLSTIAAVNALTPEAVSKNADRYVGLEAIKSSLGATIREKQMLAQQKKAEEEYNKLRKHDRFV